ncbi:hypothetical protein N7532_000155 [Penicillium argentinense]|uniref:RNA polymerase I-specific transcription initiation factor RRN6-like protein n=1 Tax=Penicillium argentinense TaxID=1131581 RepID=A0A9W9KMZ8_9EURO|nr:uncharacterized protein N7532_000155 [Penicillium argentinense]KAJ5112110.1 hypothetical protein N7532_000155 [Penicillium argentinense]
MDEHRTVALHYGHVGRATYLPETRSWTFTRQFRQPPLLVDTGNTRTTVLSPVKPAQPQQHINPRLASEHNLIPKTLPEFAANWSSLWNDTLSRTITNTAERYDPLVSTLLALGEAKITDQASRIRMEVVAAVTGECGNTISFRTLGKHVDTLDQDVSPLIVPSIADDSIGDEEVTEWSRHGAPIQQICFSRSLEKSCWMAARLPQSTVIFRPRYYRRTTHPVYMPEDDLATCAAKPRNSTLDPNPVVEILITHTGNLPHADVTFNPWYPRQFAIIDIQGNWSTWEVYESPSWPARCLKRGSLPWMDGSHKTQTPDGPRYDGWASIEWIADYSTIVVSDRRHVMLYSIGGKQIRSTSVELDLFKKSEWVLDVQRSPQNLSHFFVLTTTRLFWFDLATAPFNETGVRPPLFPRLTWRHFRDPEDTTLRFSDLQMNGNLYLILYSRLSSIVQIFQAPSLDEETNTFSIPDVVRLDVPSAAGTSPLGASSRYSTFVFRQVNYMVAPVQSPEVAKYRNDLTLVKVFWTDTSSSSAVHEALFRGPNIKADKYDVTYLPVREGNFLCLRSMVHPHRMPKSEVEGDDFVVGDWDESTHAPPRTGNWQRGAVWRNSHAGADDQFQRTMDWRPLYDIVLVRLNGDANQGASKEIQPRNTLSRMVEELANKTLKTLADWYVSETMVELCTARSVLDDIDEGAQDLARLVSTALPKSPDPKAEYRFMILPLHFSKLFHGMPIIQPGRHSDMDYLGIYEQLVADWVTSLPHGPDGIHSQTRVFKEKMIRGIALDLFLARLVRISNTPGVGNLPQATELLAQDQLAPTPATLSQDTVTSLLSSQPPSSQIAPNQRTPTPQSRSRASSAGTSDDKPYSSLAAFTTFQEQRPLPRKVANLLSEWQPGVDPSTYEWQKTSEMLENEEFKRASRSATPSQRLRRKRSRSQSVAGSQALGLSPAPAAPILRTWGSQPDNAPSLPFTSSQPTVDETPMTQAERGQFGAREGSKALKAKKKRRAAGF